MGQNEKPKTEWSCDQERDSLLTLQKLVILDAAEICEVNAIRDIETVNRRCIAEGLSFCTKTLPVFGKNVLRSYQMGQFQQQTAFHTRSGWALPDFLIGFTELIFDSKTGALLSDPCYVAAWAVHQITSWLYKYDWPIKPEVTRMMLEELIRTNDELPNTLNLGEASPIRRDITLDYARRLVDTVLSVKEGEDTILDIVPRHGPGATNEGTLSQPNKYWFRRFDRLLDSHYPQGKFTSPSGVSAVGRPGFVRTSKSLAGRSFNVDFCDPPTIGIDRALRTSITRAVPKDSRGPRFISMEAKELMYLQQGQRRWLVRKIQQNALCRGHVNFDDQSINAALALEGSVSGLWATLDMKEASERVSVALVGELFLEFVFAALWATRSRWTLITFPETREEAERTIELELNKFSPMGSAVCFPIEALVFWALSVAAIQISTRCSAKQASDVVYVYGDDIIIPPEHVECVTKSLELFGLKVNTHKSFWRGPFRESCGMDAFSGCNITPIRLKKRIPMSKADAESLVSWAEVANQCEQVGLRRVAEFMFDHVETILGPLPLGPPHSGIISRWTMRPLEQYLKPAPRRPLDFSSNNFGIGSKLPRTATDSVRPDYHGYLIKGWSVTPLTEKPSPEEYPEEHAWMHYVTLKGSSPHPVDTTSRAFSPRNVVKLHQKVKSVS